MIVLKGHATNQRILSIAFSQDGSKLASSCNDGTVRLWDLATSACQILENGLLQGFGFGNVTFSPDGKSLAWLNTRRIILVDLEHLEPRLIDWPDRVYARRIHFGREGKVLFAVGNPVWSWESNTGEALPQWSTLSDWDGSSAISHDGNILATGHCQANERTGRYIHEVQLHQTETGEQLGALRGHTQLSTEYDFSPTRRFLAAACSQHLVVFELTTGNIVVRHKLGGKHYKAVAFTPDERFLGAAHNYKTVNFWDTQTWQQREGYDWGIGPVSTLAMAPDGQRAAAGGKSGKIVVWDLDF